MPCREGYKGDRQTPLSCEANAVFGMSLRGLASIVAKNAPRLAAGRFTLPVIDPEKRRCHKQNGLVCRLGMAGAVSLQRRWCRAIGRGHPFDDSKTGGQRLIAGSDYRTEALK